MAILEFPHDGQKPVWVPLEINRDEPFNRFSIEAATSYIYSGYNWAKELSGYSSAKAGIGANILIDLFTIKNETVIKKWQAKSSLELDTIFSAIWDRLGREDLKDYSIQFPDNISGIVESIKLNNATNAIVESRGQESGEGQ